MTDQHSPSPSGGPDIHDLGAHDLVVRGAGLVATMDASRRELVDGWVAIDGGLIAEVGTGPAPAGRRTIDAAGGLVTPGLINTHHHLYQNLTRSFAPALDGGLFDWLTTLYPVWARLDEEASFLSTWVGVAELALGGCTTSSDHLYVHPREAGDLIGAQVAAAREFGLRFTATRGSMSLSQKDGGLPPDSVVQTDDEILADSERLVAVHHDPSHGSMTQVALAPCSPFSVTPALMRATAELAERLDVRLHTHLAEDVDEDAYCLATHGCRPLELFEDVGWGSDRAWVAHCVYPSADEIARLATWGTGVAHCPSSNQLIGAGLAPIREFRDAGVPVGLGCDGSASTDAASLWLECRAALLLGRLRGGPASMRAREVLEMATLGGARCLGRRDIGSLAVDQVADLVVWPMDGVAFAGAVSDPIEAWLRCGPVSAGHTIIDGQVIVSDGALVDPRVGERLRDHRRIATEWLAAVS